MPSKKKYPADYSGDGFEVTRGRPGKPASIAISRWSREAERVLRRHRISVVGAGTYDRDVSAVVRRLPEFARQIKCLSVGRAAASACAAISELHNLEFLSLSSPSQAVDFSRLRRLRECSLHAPATLGNIGAARGLRTLVLWEIREMRDLSALSSLQRLRHLQLHQIRGLVSLEGIQSLPLRKLRIIYPRSLRSIAPLRAVRTLESLELVGGSGVTDIEHLGALRELQAIAVTSGPTFPSFDFLKRLRKLRELSLENTAIASRRYSIAPLARLPRLRKLVLYAGTKSGFKGIFDLEELTKCRSLEWLTLDRGPGFRSEAFVKEPPRLQHLNLTRTPLI